LQKKGHIVPCRRFLHCQPFKHRQFHQAVGNLRSVMADLPKVTFASFEEPKEKTIVLFADEGKGLSPMARRLDERAGGMLSRAMTAAEFKAKKKKTLEIFAPPALEAASVLIVGLGSEGLGPKDWLELGGAVRGKLGGKAQVGAVLDVPGVSAGDATSFAQGFSLRCYEFKKYKTKHGKKREEESEAGEGDEENGSAAQKGAPSLTVYTSEAVAAGSQFEAESAVLEGVYFARDLVNEPANMLTPPEFASRLQGLSQHGIEVEVLDEDRLRSLGMTAL